MYFVYSSFLQNVSLSQLGHLGTFVWDTWVTSCSMSCSSLIFEVICLKLCSAIFCHLMLFIQIIPSIVSVCVAVLVHLKDDAATIKNRKRMFISLYFILPDLLCYILLHSIHISTKFRVFPFKWYQEYANPCFWAWATGL